MMIIIKPGIWPEIDNSVRALDPDTFRIVLINSLRKIAANPVIADQALIIRISEDHRSITGSIYPATFFRMEWHLPVKEKTE